MLGNLAADLAHRLAVGRGHEPADLVLKGGRVLSVFTCELLEADVAIAGDTWPAWRAATTGSRRR